MEIPLNSSYYILIISIHDFNLYSKTMFVNVTQLLIYIYLIIINIFKIKIIKKTHPTPLKYI